VALTRLAPVTQAYLSALVSVDAATGAAVSLMAAKFEPVTYVYRIETHVASVSLTFIAFSEGDIAVDGGAAALGLKTMTVAGSSRFYSPSRFVIRRMLTPRYCLVCWWYLSSS
jgi:hypothetical protein